MRDPRIDPRPEDILLRRFKDAHPSAITVTERRFGMFKMDKVTWIGPIGEESQTIDLWRGMVADAEVLHVAE